MKLSFVFRRKNEITPQPRGQDMTARTAQLAGHSTAVVGLTQLVFILGARYQHIHRHGCRYTAV